VFRRSPGWLPTWEATANERVRLPGHRVPRYRRAMGPFEGRPCAGSILPMSPAHAPQVLPFPTPDLACSGSTSATRTPPDATMGSARTMPAAHTKRVREQPLSTPPAHPLHRGARTTTTRGTDRHGASQGLPSLRPTISFVSRPNAAGGGARTGLSPQHKKGSASDLPQPLGRTSPPSAPSYQNPCSTTSPNPTRYIMRKPNPTACTVLPWEP